jgi:transposase
VLISHRIALDPNHAQSQSCAIPIMRNPNHAQATYFARAAGTARFAYNWALRKWQRQYEAWKADNSQPALRNLPCAGS